MSACARSCSLKSLDAITSIVAELRASGKGELQLHAGIVVHRCGNVGWLGAYAQPFTIPSAQAASMTITTVGHSCGIPISTAFMRSIT